MKIMKLLAALVAVAAARKSFLVKEHHSVLQAPKVYAYDTNWYFFNKNGYSYQIDNTVTDIIGWEFDQYYGYVIPGSSVSVKHYRMRLSLYFQQEFLLHPALRLGQLYNSEMFIDIPKFRSNAFVEFAWYPMSTDNRRTSYTH